MTINLRRKPRKTDVREIAERVDEISDHDNDAAVCAVLRWSIRAKAGPTAALETCQQLGLDLRAALRRARERRRNA